MVIKFGGLPSKPKSLISGAYKRHEALRRFAALICSCWYGWVNKLIDCLYYKLSASKNINIDGDMNIADWPYIIKFNPPSNFSTIQYKILANIYFTSSHLASCTNLQLSHNKRQSFHLSKILKLPPPVGFCNTFSMGHYRVINNWVSLCDTW